jgi:hypothetical protein
MAYQRDTLFMARRTDYRWNDEAELWETQDGTDWIPSVPMDGYGEEDGTSFIAQAGWTTIHERVMSERDRKRLEDGPRDSELPTFDEALGASLPSPSYVNAMRNAGRTA